MNPDGRRKGKSSCKYCFFNHSANRRGKMSATEPTSKFNEIFLSSSPHFTKGDTTQRIMLTVLIAMLPECVYGVYLFGLRAFITILASVTGCIVFEYLFQKATK